MHLALSPYTSNAVDKILQLSDFLTFLLSLSSCKKTEDILSEFSTGHRVTSIFLQMLEVVQYAKAKNSHYPGYRIH